MSNILTTQEKVGYDVAYAEKQTIISSVDEFAITTSKRIFWDDALRGGSFTFDPDNSTKSDGVIWFNGYYRDENTSLKASKCGLSITNTIAQNTEVMGEILKNEYVSFIDFDGIVYECDLISMPTKSNTPKKLYNGGIKYTGSTLNNIFFDVKLSAIKLDNFEIDGNSSCRIVAQIEADYIDIVNKSEIHHANCTDTLNTALCLRLNDFKKYRIDDCNIHHAHSKTDGTIGTSAGAARCIYISYFQSDSLKESPTEKSFITNNILSDVDWEGDLIQTMYSMYDNVSRKSNLEISGNKCSHFNRRALKIYADDTVIVANNIDMGTDYVTGAVSASAITCFGSNNSIYSNNIVLRGVMGGINTRGNGDSFEAINYIYLNRISTTAKDENEQYSQTAISATNKQNGGTFVYENVINNTLTPYIGGDYVNLIDMRDCKNAQILSNKFINPSHSCITTDVNSTSVTVDSNIFINPKSEGQSLILISGNDSVIVNHDMYFYDTSGDVVSNGIIIDTGATGIKLYNNKGKGLSRYGSIISADKSSISEEHGNVVYGASYKKPTTQILSLSAIPTRDTQIGTDGDIVFNSSASASGDVAGWKCTADGNGVTNATWVDLPALP